MTPNITVHFDGREIPLRLTHRYVCQAEYDLKVNIISPGNILENFDTASFYKVAVLLYAGMLHAKPIVEEDIIGIRPNGDPIYKRTARNYTLDEILDKLTPAAMQQVEQPISEALLAYIESVKSELAGGSSSDDAPPLAETTGGSESGASDATTSG
jgi:hypothetical protein